MFNLVYVAAFLALAANIQAQYVIDKQSGCVDISVEVPGPFKVLRIDQTDYNFDGTDSCEKSWDPSDKIACGLTKDGEKFTATATVCEVESHISAGFRMDDYMQDHRYAFVEVYFSHGGSWKGIEKNCIQPALSSPAEINAVGQSSVDIDCARLSDCPMGPTTTIMTASHDLCRDYSEPGCNVEDLGDKKVLSTTFEKPEGEKTSWVFCSTLDTFLSYHIRWA